MRKAVQRKRKSASSAPIHEAQAASIQNYRDKLAQHFGKQKHVAVVAVLLSVKDVPLEQMEKLTEALLDSLGTARLVS